MIIASEIASWAFCPESWRLRHGLDLIPDDRPIQIVKELQTAGLPVPAKVFGNAVAAQKFLEATAAGTARHEDNAAAEHQAAVSINLGRVFLGIAALALLWLLRQWW